MEGTDMEPLELKDEHDKEWTPPLLAGYALEGYQKLGLTFLHKMTTQYGFTLISDYMGIGKLTTQNYSELTGLDPASPCLSLEFMSDQ